METLIAMQDIRTRLASIADRVEHGERFIVIRNSRPVFRIEPVQQEACGAAGLSLREVRARFESYRVQREELTPAALDAIIRETRSGRAHGTDKS
jgi:antitoxin (DNA-binding transcriptional repressor) of toxin-antitoxin stability system